MAHTNHLLALLLLLPHAAAQTAPDPPNARARAEKDFQDAHWQDAFNEFKALHEQSPANATLTEFLAESALNLNNLTYAHDLLVPLLAEDPNRWLAIALLTRYYAQTGNDAERDKGLATLQRMHDSGQHPRLAAQNTILLERHDTPDGGSVGIWYSLKPWGRFNAYLYARYLDKDGHETSWMTLESADPDQALWAKSHPTQAAAGERVFTLDFSRVPIKNPDGTATGLHATMGFFDGKPPYNQIRDRMIASVTRVTGAISSTQATSARPSSTH